MVAPLARFRRHDVELAGAHYVILSVAAAPPQPIAGLTAAETAVVRLAALGMSNREIARARSTRTATTQNQLASVFRKLVVGSRTEAIAVLRARGLLAEQPVGLDDLVRAP